MTSPLLDALVIGAGHAGLAMSKRLSSAGVEHVVLERGEIGNTWRTQRWDSFKLNTPNWMMEALPEHVASVADPDAFATTAEWLAELERYARDHRLPVRTGVAVISVQADGDAFAVRTAESELIARNVVIAAGYQNSPRLPALAAELPSNVLRMTTAEYRRPDQLPPGAVLVVGSAQSGCQIAEDLRAAGREVYLSSGRVGRLPRRLRGRDAMRWLVDAGWFVQRPQDLPDPAMTRWAQPQTSGLGPRGHTVSYRSLAEGGVTLLGRLDTLSGGRARFADDLPRNVAFADEVAARIRKAVDDFIARIGVDAPPTEPDAADEPHDLGRFSAPTEIDLADRGIRSVVFSVGFDCDLSCLRMPVLDERGMPTHVEGRAPIDGVWFVGMPWMRTRRSGIIWGAGDDTAVIADSVVSRLGGRPVARA